MALESYPVGSASGFSEESDISSELDRLIYALGERQASFVVDPFAGGDFDESHSGSSLTITIDTGGTGRAFLGGHYVQNDGNSIDLSLDPSATNEIFVRAADQPISNADVTFTSDGTTPTGQQVMKIWEATTDSSGVTGTTDFRPYIPYRGSGVNDAITGRKQGVSGTITTDTTGVKTTSVSFTNPYIAALDSAKAWLHSLSDTAAIIDNIRVQPGSYSTTGFTIEANVTTAGASGATADFRWEAYGE